MRKNVETIVALSLKTKRRKTFTAPLDLHLYVMNTASSKVRSRVSNFGLDKRPRSHGEKEKNIWSSMLDSVASGRKLPEKQLLVLGQLSHSDYNSGFAEWE